MDNCCFNRPFDDQSQLRIKLETEAKTRIQEYVLKQEIMLVWSYMLDYENDMNPFEERRSSIQTWEELAEIVVEENADITKISDKLFKIGLRAKDSIHISCAIDAGCDYFLTTDDKILSRNNLVREIEISDPIDFIKEFEK
jgi:predicted nucleic acid-binding protein